MKDYPSSARRGLSLIETMIALTIFAVTSLGVFATVIHVRKSAEETLRSSIAFSAAAGFMEQILGMTYGTLVAPDGTLAASVPTRIDQENLAPLNIGQVNRVKVPLHSRDDGTGRLVTASEMELLVVPRLVNLRVNEDFSAVEITIEYSWENPLTRSFSTGNIKTIRANVRTNAGL